MFLKDQWRAFEYALRCINEERNEWVDELENNEKTNHLDPKLKKDIEKRIIQLQEDYDRFASYLGIPKKEDGW